ncbi:hypothetical protein RCIP0018_00009 [Klebsiella phage RCIP0018]
MYTSGHNLEKVIKSERKREKQAFDEFMPKNRKKTQARGGSMKRKWMEV